MAGVAFGYYVVLPGALHFLLNFNAGQFTVQVRAGDYYGFVTLTLLAMGIVFQVPMGILASPSSASPRRISCRRTGATPT